MGDDPQLRDPRLNFTVEGVAGEDDLTPAQKSLRGCTKFPACRGMFLYCHVLLILFCLFVFPYVLSSFSIQFIYFPSLKKANIIEKVRLAIFNK